MPSTETRRYADLITLIREVVNDAEEFSPLHWIEIRREIVDLANPEEVKALETFATWFIPDSYDGSRL